MSHGHRSQEKQERNENNRDTRAQAHGKFLKISDLKARMVLDQIKGKSVPQALGILANSPRYAAYLITKVLKSAAANADHNLGLNPEGLYVQEAIANRGTSYSSRFRLRPRAKGRGYRIERKYSHISIILNEIKKNEKQKNEK